MLKRYQSDHSHIVPIEEIEVRPDFSFEEEPVQILDREVKVLWRNHGIEEATCEPKEIFHQQYHRLFELGKFQGRNFFKEGRVVTTQNIGG
ncbi:ABC transporter G family member 33-like [Gossypium australe]|uniref:ABC transporter G family member 33-like n=1 Tax=Gossypium australe TaxID=47621 RepID=A0A5B6WQH5_9ROSI|nr:ABC transporter G family member 33-like [Gossypium australe]